MRSLLCRRLVQKSDIEQGEIYTLVVDRISHGGNGIIDLDSDRNHINVGQLDCEAGTEIEVKIVDTSVDSADELVIGKCLTQSAILDGYKPIEPPRPEPEKSKRGHMKSYSKNKLLKGLR